MLSSGMPISAAYFAEEIFSAVFTDEVSFFAWQEAKKMPRANSQKYVRKARILKITALKEALNPAERQVIYRALLIAFT